MDHISFNDYDRITDILLYLSNTVTLSFTVSLSKKAKDGSRSFFHYETMYNSRYIGQQYSRSIKRIMNYFFVLDNKDDFGNGFVLRPQDVYILLLQIENELFPYYFDPKKRIFKIKENKLFIIGDYSPVLYAQNEYKVLSFEPIVLEYQDGFKEGILFTLNGQPISMDIDRFLGFYYILKNTDMYSAACNLATYVKSAPYGVNVFQQKGLGGGGPLPDQDWVSTNDIADNNNSSRKGNFLDNIKQKKGE